MDRELCCDMRGEGTEVSPQAQPQLRLGPKYKLNKYYTPDPGRNWPKTIDLLRNVTVRTLPRTPGGGGKDKNEKQP